MQAPRRLFLMMALIALLATAVEAQRASAQSQAANSTPLPDATTRSLKIGVIPYLSPGTLIAEYAALRDFLSTELKRPVIVHTALDLRQFIARTERRDFDIVLTAPHLLQRTMALGYLPLMAIRADFYAHILVPAGSPVRNLRDLVGKRLHTPPPSAFASIAIERFLGDLGYRIDSDFRGQQHNSENNALLAAARSNADAVAASRAVVQRLPPEIRAKLKVIASTPAAVSMLLLASPYMPPGELARLRAAIAAFPYSPTGLTYTAQSGSYMFPATAELVASIQSEMATLQARVGTLP